MKDPVWIRDDIVVAIHQRQLAEHGGMTGVRDEGLLASALQRPKNLLLYSEDPPDLAALAAAYAFGIIRNHSFADGNKRTAFVICRAFLILNEQDLEALHKEKVFTFLELAAGRMSEDELADWIRNHSRSVINHDAK